VADVWRRAWVVAAVAVSRTTTPEAVDVRRPVHLAQRAGPQNETYIFSVDAALPFERHFAPVLVRWLHVGSLAQ
jgi:hypothetical protein